MNGCHDIIVVPAGIAYAPFLIAHFLPKTTKGGKDVAGSCLVVEVRRGLA